MISIVMTTFKTRKEAKRISDALLKKNLAACVKLGDIESSYLWRGKVENHKEVLMTIVTKKSNAKRVMREIKERHSYEVPEIIEISSGKTSPEYSKWVSSTCR